jgi:hypothetical protein
MKTGRRAGFYLVNGGTGVRMSARPADKTMPAFPGDYAARQAATTTRRLGRAAARQGSCAQSVGITHSSKAAPAPAQQVLGARR